MAAHSEAMTRLHTHHKGFSTGRPRQNDWSTGNRLAPHQADTVLELQLYRKGCEHMPHQ